MIQLVLNEKNRTDRKPFATTDKQMARFEDIKNVMEELKEFWPLTIRQIYYRLKSSYVKHAIHWHRKYKGEYGQVDIYNALIKSLKWMRILEVIPWNSIIDENRIITAKLGYTNKMDFICEEADNFLSGYKRCLAQKQTNYIEVWIEKAALLHVVKPITDFFCLRTICCRGYNSVTFQSDFYIRATEAINAGQQPIVLYFGDWDPSGEAMILSAIQTLQDELDLVGVHYYRAGINPDQFDQIDAEPIDIEENDKRTQKFLAKYPNSKAYELDAFHPKELQELVQESIKEFSDVHAVVNNIEKETEEQKVIDEVKRHFHEYFVDKLVSMGLN